MKKKSPVKYTCNHCNTKVSLPEWRYKRLKNKTLCGKCSTRLGLKLYNERLQNNPDLHEKKRKKVSNGLKRWHSTRTFEEKSKVGRYARSKVNMSGKELRKRQQEFINNAPEEYYEAYCEKRKQIALNFHAGLSDKEKKSHYEKVFSKRSISKASNDFLNEISEKLSLQLEPEFYVKGFFCDALIKNTNLIIEFFGDMYHCNPENFDDPKQYCSWINRTVEEQWKRDEKRTAALLRNGYRVIIVWEKDWNTEPKRIIERIKNEMYKN
ncbi:MAG: hypothetical protein ACOC80_16315 [Petrotogales bacterium]